LFVFQNNKVDRAQVLTSFSGRCPLVKHQQPSSQGDYNVHEYFHLLFIVFCLHIDQ